MNATVNMNATVTDATVTPLMLPLACLFVQILPPTQAKAYDATAANSSSMVRRSFTRYHFILAELV
jgi:hypothetical protein